MMKKIVVTAAVVMLTIGGAAAVTTVDGAGSRAHASLQGEQVPMGARSWVNECQGVVVEWIDSATVPSVASYSCSDPAQNQFWTGSVRGANRWVNWEWQPGDRKPSFQWGFDGSR